MRINFDFLDLEAFVAVKETGSFHAASERLHLSQSSVTRRVQKLEEALGTSLFERTTRDVRPTLAAKRLQLRAESILQDAKETTRAMRDEEAAFRYQQSQIVTLATVPTVMAGLVCPALKAFKAAGNSARVRVMDLAANEVAEAVSQGDADFGICSIPMLETNTEFELLFSEPIVLVVHPNHALAAYEGLGWRDLSDQALILPSRGTGNRLLIDEALARNDSPVRWTYEVGRSATALEMVAQNVGVALLPRMAVQGLRGRDLTTKPIVDPLVSRPVGILTLQGQTERRQVRALKDALREQRVA